MVPAPDPMGAPSSLTARRPNASNLPNFELPPPPLAALQQKYSNYSPLSSSHSAPTATTLTSVGNLLTPPSNASGDGLSPGSSVPTSGSLSHHSAVQPFTPGSSGMWHTSTSASTPYGFQSAGTPNSFSQRGGLFSPSLNSIVRGTGSPAASEGLPPPPYEISSYPASMSMSASSMATTPGQSQMMNNGMMGGQGGHVSHASPVHGQESFSRLPPTPTYYNGPQSASAPPQASFSYSAGPSMQHSPISSGGPLSKMSPMSHHGSIPPLQAQPQQYSQPRSYNYSMPGPVLSNVNNPTGQLALVGGGMPHGMVSPFNSGHAAQIHHMYGHHHHQQPNPQNDRPFRCDQCPQSFNRNHDLKRHKRIHLAVKPFPCGHCDKSFSRKDALKRHVLVKGCGKAQTTTEVKELDGSSSPEPHSDSGTSPVVSSTT